MMRSSCADVPDEIKSRRLPRASERSTFAVVFPPAAPLTLMTVGMIRFTFGCHATVSAAFLPVLPPIMVVCAPPSLFRDMTSYCARSHIKKPLPIPAGMFWFPDLILPPAPADQHSRQTREGCKNAGKPGLPALRSLRGLNSHARPANTRISG